MTAFQSRPPAKHAGGHADEASRRPSALLPIPLALRASLLTQLAVWALIVCLSMLAGLKMATLMGLSSMLAILFIYRLLATRSHAAWRGACQCAVLGLIVLGGVTVVATIQSSGHGLIGIGVCGLQLQYILALTTRTTRKFYSSPTANTKSSRNWRERATVLVAADLYDEAQHHRPSALPALMILGGFFFPTGNATGADELSDLLDRLPADYQPKVAVLKQRLKAFDGQMQQHRSRFNSHLKIQARHVHDQFSAEGITAASKWLDQGGELPRNEIAETLIFTYVEKVAASQDKVWPQAEVIALSLRNDNRPDLADAVLQAFAELGGSITMTCKRLAFDVGMRPKT